MTFSLAAGAGDRLTLRYLPLLAWGFMALTSYGIGSIVLDVRGGARPLSGGTLFAVGLLAAMVLFVASSAGQLVVCRFDRAADQLRITRYGLHGRAVQTRPISAVVGLEVRVLRRAQHRLELRLRSGELLPLTPYYVVALRTGAIERLSALLGVQPALIQPSRGPN